MGRTATAVFVFAGSDREKTMGTTRKQKRMARAAKRANGGKKVLRSVYLRVRKAATEEEAVGILKESKSAEKEEA